MAHGEGSHYQRSDGKWVAQLDVGWTPRGTRKRRTKVCKNEPEAKRVLRDMRRELLAGESTGLNPRTTVKQWTDAWLPIYRARARPRTYDVGASWCARWIVPTIGRRPLAELTAGDVRAVADAVTGAGLSPTTANNISRLLRTMLGDAVREGYRVPEPALRVALPAKATSERDAIPVASAALLLQAAAAKTSWPDLEPTGNPAADKITRNRRRLALDVDVSRWVAALLQGMRQGECLGLTWDRVNLEGGTLDISWQLQVIKPDAPAPANFEVRRLDGSYCLTRPKSRAGVRVIPLVPWMAQALADWQMECPRTPWGLVWPSAAGMPMRKTDDLEAWRGLQEAAGVRKGENGLWLVHEARHTTVTLLLALGVSPQVILTLVGHSSFASTQSYAHVDLAPARQALDAAAVQLGLTTGTMEPINPS